MSQDPSPHTYSLGAVSRITGLSPHVIRAWERRYRAIEPGRTPGGTRRYSEAQLRRLQLLQQAVSGGHRIGDLAGRSDADLRDLLSSHPPPHPHPGEEIFDAIARLDAREAERLLTLQFGVLGPARFAREIVLPLLREVGDRWRAGDLPIAAEHMTSTIVQGILALAMRASAASAGRRRVLLTTPEGERHEFGVMLAALVTLGAGGNALYLGPDLPVDEVVRAARLTSAGVVILGVVHLEPPAVRDYLVALRAQLDAEIEIWLGGGEAPDADAPEGVVMVDGLDDLEVRIRAAYGHSAPEKRSAQPA